MNLRDSESVLDRTLFGRCVDCREYPALGPNDLTVLGRCPHGVDLDREFCPEGCRV